MFAGLRCAMIAIASFGFVQREPLSSVQVTTGNLRAVLTQQVRVVSLRVRPTVCQSQAFVDVFNTDLVGNRFDVALYRVDGTLVEDLMAVRSQSTRNPNDQP